MIGIFQRAGRHTVYANPGKTSGARLSASSTVLSGHAIVSAGNLDINLSSKGSVDDRQRRSLLVIRADAHSTRET